jgi:hypothetical protein
MAFIARVVVVFFSYVLACIAAAIVFIIGLVTPYWSDFAASGFPTAAIWVVVAVGAPVVGAVAFLPTMLVIVIAEGFAWRWVVFYAALGGALALALSYGIDLPGGIGEPGTYFARGRQLVAASGIAGGLVYWLFAGRNAGAWK